MFRRPDNEIIFVGMMFHWVRFVSNSIRELLKNGRAVGAKPNFSACGAPMRHFFGLGAFALFVIRTAPLLHCA